MNKLQLVNKVIKTMKDKEDLKAKMTVEGSAPDTEFSFTKVMDPEKRKGHRGFQHGRGCGHGHHEGHHGHGMKDMSREEIMAMKASMGRGHGGRCHKLSWRNRLSMISLAFDILNNLEVEELDGGRKSLTLTDKNLPDELKAQLREIAGHKHGMKHKSACNGGAQVDSRCGEQMEGKQAFKHYLSEMKEATMDLRVLINENNEVEEIEIKAAGQVTEGQCDLHAVAEVL